MNLRATVSLDAIAADPRKAAALTPVDRSACVLKCSAVLAALAGGGLQEPERSDAASPAEEADRLLTIPQAADVLGFATSYVYEMIRRGTFPAVRHGKYVRVRYSALAEWVRRKENGLDFSISNMLSSSYGHPSSKGAPEAPPTHPSGARKKARRTPDDRLEVGDGGRSDPRADGARSAAPGQDDEDRKE